MLLPHESHGYLARESVLHVLAEQFDWLRPLAQQPGHLSGRRMGRDVRADLEGHPEPGGGPGPGLRVTDAACRIWEQDRSGEPSAAL